MFRTLLLLLTTSLICAQNTEADWNAFPLDARPTIKIEAKTDNSDSWSSKNRSDRTGTEIALRVKKESGSTSIRWFQIVPDLSNYYKNANHPWEENPYKWVGYGKIEYLRREIVPWRDKWEIDSVTADDLKFRQAGDYYQHDLGSFWFQAEVESEGKRKRSPGLQENTTRNLSPSVFRITIRKDDSYLGHLSGFFNVPGVFGSVPYQCANYIGVDCADVLVTARQKWKGLGQAKDYNVAMLVNSWPRVANFKLKNGTPAAAPIQWGEKIRPGDLIAVKYSGRNTFQHIGALYEDSNQNGLLDKPDLILHAGPAPLHLTPLRRGSFDGEVVVLRPTK